MQAETVKWTSEIKDLTLVEETQSVRPRGSPQHLYETLNSFKEGKISQKELLDCIKQLKFDATVSQRWTDGKKYLSRTKILRG